MKSFNLPNSNTEKFAPTAKLKCWKIQFLRKKHKIKMTAQFSCCKIFSCNNI